MALLLGASATTLVVIAISLPITYALAVMSWKLIEAPALRLKKRYAGPAREPRVRVPDIEPPVMEGRAPATI